MLIEGPPGPEGPAVSIHLYPVTCRRCRWWGGVGDTPYVSWMEKRGALHFYRYPGSQYSPTPTSALVGQVEIGPCPAAPSFNSAPTLFYILGSSRTSRNHGSHWPSRGPWRKGKRWTVFPEITRTVRLPVPPLHAVTRAVPARGGDTESCVFKSHLTQALLTPALFRCFWGWLWLWGEWGPPGPREPASAQPRRRPRELQLSSKWQQPQ